jgi:hypothetical protein
MKQDNRFEAALAGGSMVHEGCDELSDVDLLPVARTNAYAAVTAQRRSVAEQFGDLLAALWVNMWVSLLGEVAAAVDRLSFEKKLYLFEKSLRSWLVFQKEVVLTLEWNETGARNASCHGPS